MGCENWTLTYRVMNILVLSQDIGKTAPGIVFERLLHGLTQNHDVSMDIVACNYDPVLEIKANNVQVVKYPHLHGRLYKGLVAIANTDVISHILKKKIRNIDARYDIILSLVSFHHYFGMIAGSYFKKKLNIKWACYLVDAIPAPGGWLPEDAYFRAVKGMIGEYLPQVDMLASVSAEMLKYQLSLFYNKEKIIKDVIFPPSESSMIEIFKEKDKFIKRFLYTGNIYGLRRSKYIIEAFSLLYKENKDVELVFVGNCNQSVRKELTKYNDEIASRIHLYSRTNDLKPYIEKATALIDIDADIENDVFLSSKMSGYLICNRPIICETGEDSPSRHVFSGVPSIIQCGHNPEELKEAMVYAIMNYGQFDYSDREDILKLFRLKDVSQKLHKLLEETILAD